MNTENEQADNTVVRKHSLFEDPALSKNMEEDPVVRFFLLKWKGILTFCLILAVGFYLRGQILETSLARVKESSQVFDQAKLALQTLNNQTKPVTPEEKQKLQLSLTDSLANLKGGAEPYAELSALYSAVAAAENATTQAPVAGLEDSAWQQEKEITKRLIKELQTLVLIRNKIDAPNGLTTVVPELKNLIQQGNYADLSAFLLFVRVAESAEDKQFLKEAAQEIKTRYAEQAEKIDSAVSSL